MKKALNALLGLALAVMILGGCMPDDTAGDLKDTELAAALAVDKTEDGLGVQAELLHRDKALERQYADSYYRVAAEGVTLAEAQGNLYSRGARQINFAHAGLLLLGSAAADLENWLDFAVADDGLRPTVYPVLVEGSAADFLQSGGDLSAVYLLANALEPWGGMSGANAVTLQEFCLWLKQPGIAAVLPIVRCADEVGIEPLGLAAYDGSGWQNLSGRDALAWRILLRGKHIRGEVVDLGQGVSVKLLSARIKSEVEGLAVRYDIRIQAELADNPNDLSVREVEERLSAFVGEVLEGAVAEQRESGVDLLGLGREIWRNEPTLWAEIAASNYLAEVSAEFAVETEVESGAI